MRERRSQERPNVGIRTGIASDVPYIMRRTLKDLRNCDFFRSMRNDLFYTYIHRALEHHMTQSLVRVACPLPKTIASGTQSGDHRKILGYIIAEPSKSIGLIVIYLNTRRSTDETGWEIDNYRRQGIATKLIKSIKDDYEVPGDLPLNYVHRTSQFRYDKPWRERIDRDESIVYNPCLFYTLMPDDWELGALRKPSNQVFADVVV